MRVTSPPPREAEQDPAGAGRPTAAPLVPGAHVDSVRRERRLALAAVVALFVARGLAGATIVPPWQGPDEPSHFVLAKVLSRAGGESPALRADLERRVLESMARHGWWRHYQEATPNPIPTEFAQVPEHLSTGTLLQPMYYLLAAAVLSPRPEPEVIDDYWRLRILSLAMSAAALLCGFAGTTLLLGPVAGIGASAIVGLHPQFLLNALTVGPDALINLCGAFIWWQAGRLQRSIGWPWVLSAAAAAVAAVVAALSKRNGIPLLGIAPLLVGVSASRQLRRRPKLLFTIGVACACVVAAIVMFRGRLESAVDGLLTFWSYALVMRRPAADFTVDAAFRFLKHAVDSSWLIAGWLRFPAPSYWNAVAYLVTIAGLAGAALRTAQRGASTRALWLAWLFVAVQIGSLAAVMFVAGSAPQGRYFFAALMPMSALLWVGLTSWGSPRARGWSCVALIGVMGILDFAAFASVLMPAYL